MCSYPRIGWEKPTFAEFQITSIDITLYFKFVQIFVLQENARSNEQGAGASSQGQSSRSQGRGQGQKGSSSGGGDDREGFLIHPTKGRVPTYIFYVS